MDRIFPKSASNEYQGAPVAKWIFVALTVITLIRSLIHIFAPDGGAQSIATIPLTDFTANGAAAVIHLFALWGLSQLLFGLFYVVVLWRYQNLIPLMYLFIAVEYTGRLLLSFAKPFETSGTAPGAIGNYVIIPLALVLFALAMRRRRSALSGAGNAWIPCFGIRAVKLGQHVAGKI